MNIGILHQYSLLSSGSGMYTVQVTQRLLQRGHRVCVVCRDFRLDGYSFIDEAFIHQGRDTQRLFRRRLKPACTAHALRGEVMAVAYPRSETPNGRLFTELKDDEIREYLDFHVDRVTAIARQHRLQVLHANHVVLMPYVARQVKRQLNLPYVVIVHGSTIEYVINQDQRYRQYALAGLRGADRVIALNPEVRDRVLSICPEIEPRLINVPVGVDTGLFRRKTNDERPMGLGPSLVLRHSSKEITC
ncbi:MAG: glycosyltransferase [Anaerolineae bacterium]